MDAKDLRIESGLGDRNDGCKYSHGEVALQSNRNKTYRDVGCNPLAKAEALVAAHVRPCAVIEPDRVAPPPASQDAYVKKPSVDPWRPCPDSLYPRPPEYSFKPQTAVSPTRNISPRQTFQENMSRIQVPPTYSAAKLAGDSNINIDRNAVLSKNSKQTLAPEAKYCDVPYAVNLLPNEHKTAREPQMCAPSVNSPVNRSGPHVWPPSGANLHTPRAYGAHDIYQYPQYPSCAGPRPPVIPIARPTRTYQEEGFAYPDSFYQDTTVRFKPYPSVKERYPQARYDYISNYPNPFHPSPYAAHKFDIPNTRPLPYPVYPHLKYLDNRVPDHSMDGYQRPNQQPPLNYNTQFRNQVIHPTYAPPLGNIPNRVPSYPHDALVKSSSKPTYDNNKAYVDYENAKTKYPDSYFLNELARVHHVQKSNTMQNYTSPSMHPISMQYHRKDNMAMKAYEYNIPHYRQFEHQGLNSLGPQPQFSPSTLAISPTDSNTSNDAIQQINLQEDCGYASQSSTTSVRSVDSLTRLSNEYYRRYDYRYRQVTGNSHLIHKPESTPKDKNINVRQFWSMWNEGEEEQTSNNSPKGTTPAKSIDNNNYIHHDGSIGHQPTKMRDQLYVLGQVNVPNEELAKYEHIQKVSKLPDNIKGYNSIELLNQFEEVIESSKINNFTPPTHEFAQTLKDRKTIKQIVEVMPRPVSPLDVESKISQSIIHKDVGCNFEIKPCSPKMLNVEIAAPVHNILGERSIEKVSNLLAYKEKSSLPIQFDTNIGCNKIQRQRSTPIPYENSSCKMVGSPFTTNNMESMKTNYSLQDLETSSGVCLASLPRLDNEIELNFPEVNQQFINANKHSTPQNIQEICSNEVKNKVELPHASSDGGNDSLNHTILPVNDGTVTDSDKLSNNNKNKTYEPAYSDKESNANANRTDSVIIENPENVRKFEESKDKYQTYKPIEADPMLSVRKFEESQEKNQTYKPIEADPTPLNLTSQSLSHVNESETTNSQRKHRTSECALDYSLSKNDYEFCAYNDSLIKTTEIYQCMSDMTEKSRISSEDIDDKVHNSDGQSQISSERVSKIPITKNIMINISNEHSECGSKVKDATMFYDYDKNASSETQESSVNLDQSKSIRDQVIDQNQNKSISDLSEITKVKIIDEDKIKNVSNNLTMKHKHKHKSFKVKGISSKRFNRLKKVIKNNDDKTCIFENSNDFCLSKNQKQKLQSVIRSSNLSEAEKNKAAFPIVGGESRTNTKYFKENNSVDEKSNLKTLDKPYTSPKRMEYLEIPTDVKSITNINKTLQDDSTSSFGDRIVGLISNSSLHGKVTNVIKHSPNNSLAYPDLRSAVTKDSVDLIDVNSMGHSSPKSEAQDKGRDNNQGLDSQSDQSDTIKSSNYDDNVINSVVQCDANKIKNNFCVGLNNTNNLFGKSENTKKYVITNANEMMHETIADKEKKNRMDSGYKTNNNSCAELEDSIFENYLHSNDDSVFVEHESISKQIDLATCSEEFDRNKQIQQQSISDTCADESKKRVHKISSEHSKLHNKVEKIMNMNEFDSIDANMRILFEDTNKTSPESELNSMNSDNGTQILLRVKNENNVFDSLPGIQKEFDQTRKNEKKLNIDSVTNKSQTDTENINEFAIHIKMESTERFGGKFHEINSIEENRDGNVQLITDFKKVYEKSSIVMADDEKSASLPDTTRNTDGTNQFTEETSLKELTNKSEHVAADNSGLDNLIDLNKLPKETSQNISTINENIVNALHIAASSEGTSWKVLKKEVSFDPILKMNEDKIIAFERIDKTIMKPINESELNTFVQETTKDEKTSETDSNTIIEENNLKSLIENEINTSISNSTECFSVGDAHVNIKETSLNKLNEKHNDVLSTKGTMCVDDTYSNELMNKESLKVLPKTSKRTIKATENSSKDGAHLIKEISLQAFTEVEVLTQSETDNILIDKIASLGVAETDSNELVQKSISNTIVLDTSTKIGVGKTDKISLPEIIKNESDDNDIRAANCNVDQPNTNELNEPTVSNALIENEKDTIVPKNTANLSEYKYDTNKPNAKSFIETLPEDENVSKTDSNESIKDQSFEALTDGIKNVNVQETIKYGMNKNKVTKEESDYFKSSVDEPLTAVSIHSITCINAQSVSKLLHIHETSSNVLIEEQIDTNVHTSIMNTSDQSITTISEVFHKTNATEENIREVDIDDEKYTSDQTALVITHVDKPCTKEVFSIKILPQVGINNKTETSDTNIYANAEECVSETLSKDKPDYNYVNDFPKKKNLQVDEHQLMEKTNINIPKVTWHQDQVNIIDDDNDEAMLKKNINTKSVLSCQTCLSAAIYYGCRSKKLYSPLFQNLMFYDEGEIVNIKNSTLNKRENYGTMNLLDRENFIYPKEPHNITVDPVISQNECQSSFMILKNSNENCKDNTFQENKVCKNKLSENILDTPLKELVASKNNCEVHLLDSAIAIVNIEESFAKKQYYNEIDLKSTYTEECTVQNDIIHSQGISFQYHNNSVVSQITEKILFADDNNKDQTYNSLPINRRQSLKRSYSDSALNTHVSRDDLKENIRDLHYSWLAKRNKYEFESNNRRNSVNVGENISFCILIDDNCIITEESEEKICFEEIDTFEQIDTNEHETNVDIVDTVIPDCDEVATISEAWVENIACVDTVFSDEVAENVVISSLSSPTNSTSEFDHIDPEMYDKSCNHIDKVKFILGEKTSENDVQIEDTLYRTPHSIMNKTLLYGENNLETDDDLTDDSSDDVVHDRILIEPTDWKPLLTHTLDYMDPAHTLNDFRLETPENKENVFVKDLSPLRKIDDYLDVSSAENENDEHAMSQNLAHTNKTSKNDKVASCETSLDNVYENKETEYPNYSSSEVSSTTSEDKNSCILLKITNLNGSRVSEINEIKTSNRPRCKFTEKKDYSTSNYRFPNRPLLTKAAQKYIPPIKETIRDLKVKITLPQQSLLKFKQLKLSQNDHKLNKHSNIIPRIPKKSKPNFDDVLKSIDEMHRRKHIKKNKKGNTVVPKVVIKKNVNGSHYASTPKKDSFNPDLTGRRWQPWVFLEKSHFIDQMAIRNKTRAVYNYRKRTYVLKENFKKYKSTSNTKFVISQPKTPGKLKCTIRLKHTY